MWILFVLSIGVISFLFRKAKYSFIQVIILGALLSSFVIFGSSTMQDFQGYINFYNSGKYIWPDFDLWLEFKKTYTGLSGGFEPLYVFLNAFFSYFGVSAFVFFFVLFMITNCLFIMVFRKYAPLGLAVFLFVCTQLFFQQGNLIRQMFSSSILFFGLTKIIEGKNFLSFGKYVVLASLFHISSLLFMVVYPMTRVRLNFFLVLGAWFVSLFFYLNPSFFPSTSLFSGEVFAKELTQTAGVGVQVEFNWVYNVVFLICLLYYRRNSGDHIFTVLFYSFFLGIFLGNLVKSSEWFYRMSLYFLPTYILMLSKLPMMLDVLILDGKTNVRSKLTTGLVVLFFILYPVKFTFSGDFTGMGSEWVNKSYFDIE